MEALSRTFSNRGLHTPHTVGYASYMTTTKNTAAQTATTAQAARIALIRKDTTNRLTLRKGAAGSIIVSEYDPESGDVHQVTVLPDGLYAA